MAPGSSFAHLWDYTAPEGHSISVRNLSLESPYTEREKTIFVSSFVTTYKDENISPDQINSSCKTYQDLTIWLEKIFDEEWTRHQSLSGVTNLGVFKDEMLVAFAILYPWRDEKETVYIRLLAISPEEQKKGYGSALLNTIRNHLGTPMNHIIADTRFIYSGAREFYKKRGFLETQTHDESLDRERYLGVEWKSWKYMVEQHKALLDESLYTILLNQLEAYRRGALPKIADPVIREIPIEESGEPLIDIRHMRDNLRIQMLPDPETPCASPGYNSGYASASKIRAGVYEKLVHLLKEMDAIAVHFGANPGQTSIRVFEGLRDLATQKMLFDKKAEEIRATLLQNESSLFPDLSPEGILQDPSFQDRVFQETSKWVSPLENNVPVHSTGGAVDICLFNEENSTFLDVGKFGVIWGPNPTAPTFSEAISIEQKNNRLYLIIAALRAGLINYPYEFWHFSRGR